MARFNKELFMFPEGKPFEVPEINLGEKSLKICFPLPVKKIYSGDLLFCPLPCVMCPL
jgi:hypothetical protein